MGQIAENNLWYKGKGEVLREFKKSAGAILSAVASRNFSNMPGFAIEALTDVEIETKIKLTDYNFKIMSDSIDRELKALGLEHDIALKQATMAWELEKIQLFSELQKEFADKERLRALRGEEIAGLMIDQEYREIAVLASKVAIEIEIEDIKRQKEEVDLLPLPLEEELAAAKLAVARRKLDVIPYILAALAAQSTVIDTEATLILPAREEKANYDIEVSQRTMDEILPLMEAKATATEAMTSAQSELIAPMIEKANKTNDLTTARGTLLSPMTNKATALAALTAKLRLLIDPMMQKVTAMGTLTSKQAELIDPMTRKAAATVTLTAKQGELLAPMTEKVEKIVELTTKQEDLLDPMSRKANATVALTERERELLEPITRKADKTLALAEKQTELIAPMTSKAEKSLELATAMYALLEILIRKADATNELTDALQELFDPLLEKAAASTALADEMIAQLENHILLAKEKITQAEKKILRLAEELTIMEKENTLEGKKILIEIDRAELELLRANAKVAIADALRIQLGDIRTAMTAESGAEITFINTSGANEVAIKSSHLLTVEAAKYAAQRSELSSQTSAVYRMGIADKDHSIAMANQTSQAKITEKLIHLIG